MPIILPKCVGKLADLTADDPQQRYAMSGVHVEPPDDQGWWRLTATDGRRLGILCGQSSDAENNIEALLAAQPEGEAPFVGVVPLKAWGAAFRNAQKGGRRGELQVALCFPGEGKYALLSGETATQALAVEGRFPDCMWVLKKLPAPLVQLDVDPNYLSDICKVAAAVQKDTRRVTLLFYGKGEPLGIMCKGEQGITFDALLMPLT